MIGSNLFGVVTELGIKALVITNGGGGAESSVVTIGLPNDRAASAPIIAGSARAVLDQNRLAPFSRQEIRDQSRHGIRGSTGRKGAR